MIRGPRLVILSDLHADDSTFSTPISPDAPGPNAPGRRSWIDFGERARTSVDPLHTFKATVRNEKLQAEFLVVPGDICDRANGKALESAWKVIHELAHMLGDAEVIATAGNHDLDSRYRVQPYDPRATLRGLKPSFPTKGKSDCQAFWADSWAVLERGPCRFLVVNSCAYHGGKDKEIYHGRIAQPAHGIGGYRAYVGRGQAFDALAEARQAGQRAGAVGGVQRAVRAQAGGQPHAVAQAVDHARLAVFHARDHDVEAVRPQVDRRDQLAILDRYGLGGHAGLPGGKGADSAMPAMADGLRVREVGPTRISRRSS